jgi:hypothetical protein
MGIVAAPELGIVAAPELGIGQLRNWGLGSSGIGDWAANRPPIEYQPTTNLEFIGPGTAAKSKYSPKGTEFFQHEVSHKFPKGSVTLPKRVP